MIHSIKIENFKSLKIVDLSLGDLNLFIGTNASGKSNFLDALRVLQGIGYGFTVDEIFNGKSKSATSEVWEPIRGGSQEACFSPRSQESGVSSTSQIKFTISGTTKESGPLEFCIAIAPASGCVTQEWLKLGKKEIYRDEQQQNLTESPVLKIRYKSERTGQPPILDFEKNRPILHQLLKHAAFNKDHLSHLQSCINLLSNSQRIDPSPAVLRQYAHAQSVGRMGERGENFPALVKAILDNPKHHEAYLSWLRELTPTEPSDVVIMKGAVGESLFALEEGGKKHPAHILSDGTLRFAAIAAAFFQPDMPALITLEEIENGVHPTRVRLLVELLRNQSAKGIQVLATTHSPIVLAWLKEPEYAHTYFCKRDEETGATTILPLNEIPAFLDLVSRQAISDLFAEGWLEGAL